MKKKNTSTAVSRSSIFGPPPVLEGEDAAAYDELLGHICAAVRPIDVIERIFVNDIVCFQWEILRLRRLKTSLIRSIGSKALKKFLAADSISICIGQILKKAWRKLSKRVSPKTKRENWRASALGINPMLPRRLISSSKLLD